MSIEHNKIFKTGAFFILTIFSLCIFGTLVACAQPRNYVTEVRHDFGILDVLKDRTFFDRASVNFIEKHKQEANKQFNFKKEQTDLISKDETIELAADILKLHEGFRGKAYVCASGQLTVGYGRATTNPKAMVTKAQAEQILIKHIRKNWTQLEERLDWFSDLSTGRKIALLNLTYNMGIDKLMKFEQMLKSFEEGNYEEAGDQLLQGSVNGKSKYYTQVGKRAEQVAEAIRTDHWDINELKTIYA